VGERALGVQGLDDEPGVVGAIGAEDPDPKMLHKNPLLAGARSEDRDCERTRERGHQGRDEDEGDHDAASTSEATAARHAAARLRIAAAP